MSDYTPTGAPADQTRGASGTIRSEFQAVATAIATKSDTTGETYSGTHDFSGATLVAPGKSDVAGETYSGTHDFSGASVSLGAATMTADVAAGGHKITDLANPTNPSDAANLQTVQALISIGGTPESVPITSLGVGTVNDGEIVMRSGSALVGCPLPEVVTVPVTGTTHTAVAGTRVMLTNAAATAVTAPSPVEGAEFETVPANGLRTNTVDFGAKTVQGPAGSASGVITLDAGAPLRARFNSTLDKWVML